MVKLTRHLVQVVHTSRGTLETLSGMGSGMWNATLNATSLLSSAASARSNGSKDSDSVAKQSGSMYILGVHLPTS
jgi:hypothetical protein